METCTADACVYDTRPVVNGDEYDRHLLTHHDGLTEVREVHALVCRTPLLCVCRLPFLERLAKAL